MKRGRERGREIRIAGLAVLLAVAGANLAAGDFRESFRDGVNALEDGRYPDAERHFREAIAERAEERVGGLRRTYLPHYYLGVALAEQNRCGEAMNAWAESERQGQVKKAQKEYSELPRRRQTCVDRIRAVDAARTAAEQAVARARKAEQTLAEVRGAPELQAIWSDGDPSFESRERAARAQLEEAARRIRGAGGIDAAPFQGSRTLANRTAAELDQLTSDAQTRLTELRDAASSALERLEAAEARAHAELGKVTYLKPYPRELKRRVDAVRQALDDTVRKKATAGAGELARLHGALTASADDLRRSAQAPPQSLRTAVEAFLAGNHEEVLAALEGETYREARASGQACLLQAASRHALYVLGGEQDAETAAVLYQEVVRCRDLEPPVLPKYFSPRFIGFYENPPQPVEESAEGETDPESTEPTAEDEASP